MIPRRPWKSSPQCELDIQPGQPLAGVGVAGSVRGVQSCVLSQDGLKQCLAEFRQELPWVERLDVTLGQVVDPVSQSASNKDAIDAENDFQREMSL